MFLHKSVWTVSLFTIVILTEVQSFHIRNCSSNRIHEVSWDDKEGKDVIWYDEREEINSKDALVTIWCDCETFLDKCSLKREADQTEKEMCEYSISQPS